MSEETTKKYTYEELQAHTKDFEILTLENLFNFLIKQLNFNSILVKREALDELVLQLVLNMRCIKSDIERGDLSSQMIQTHNQEVLDKWKSLIPDNVSFFDIDENANIETKEFGYE